MDVDAAFSSWPGASCSSRGLERAARLLFCPQLPPPPQEECQQMLPGTRPCSLRSFALAATGRHRAEDGGDTQQGPGIGAQVVRRHREDGAAREKEKRGEESKAMEKEGRDKTP